MDCIFCKIVDKVIPSQIVYEDKDILAFNDINPAAPVHILVIPKKHIAAVRDISSEDKDILASMFSAINKIVDSKNLLEQGYRLIINNGKAAGQEVFHLHIHILGGKDRLGPMLTR
jgi:histidine triad (HIT) family protein